jgi:penicillin-binding protein 1A
VLHGTAVRAAALKYALAGKTGTTNDFTDAGFVGFSPSLTCGVWIGYDEKKSLGPKETGSEAALPVWMDFMKVAMIGHENEQFTAPQPQPRNNTTLAQKLETPAVKTEAAEVTGHQ